MMMPACQPFRIDCTCLILALDSLTQLRCLTISWLDHRRLQPNKLRTSMSNQNNGRLSARTMTFLILKLLTRYHVPRNSNQSYGTALKYSFPKISPSGIFLTKYVFNYLFISSRPLGIKQRLWENLKYISGSQLWGIWSHLWDLKIMINFGEFN